MATGTATEFSNITSGDIDTSRVGSETRARTGQQIETVDVDEEAINALINNILGGSQGLAEVFSADSAAGIFGSTVAAQASGDLLAKVAGEVAKITATRTITEAGTDVIDTSARETREEDTRRSGFGLDLTAST